jgi:hypothetical protein
MSMDTIIGLVVGVVNLGILIYILLHSNKQQIETNAAIETSTTELQINTANHRDIILNSIQKNGELLSQSLVELQVEQISRFENLRQSLDGSIGLLKTELSRMNDAIVSEQKNIREESNGNSKNVVAEIQKLRDEVAKFRQYLDEAITV